MRDDLKKRSVLRGRFHHRLYFGEEGDPENTDTHWSFTDPLSEELDEVAHTLRYDRPMTRAQKFLAASAIESLQHLFGYPLRMVARRQFEDICRAVKVETPPPWTLENKDGWRP